MKEEVVSGPFDLFVGRQVLTRVLENTPVIVDLNGCHHSLEGAREDVGLPILEYRMRMVTMAIGNIKNANFVSFRMTLGKGTTTPRELSLELSALDETGHIRIGVF